MKKLTLLSVSLIPIFILLFIILYNSDNTENMRYDNSTQTQKDNSSEEFTSRLKDETAYEKETKTNIPSLETKTLDESTKDSEEVKAGDTITVNYRGWLAEDGTVFDQSFNRGDAGFTFTVGGGVIEGWSEGVVGMKVGEVRRLYIPSDKGYGEFGSPGAIPANADLIFDVELIRFE